jgi:hypothetical protein
MTTFYNDDDFILLDDHNREIKELQNEIEDLRFSVDNYQTDEIFMTSELMLLRDQMVSDGVGGAVLDQLNGLLNCISAPVKEKAAGLLLGIAA